MSDDDPRRGRPGASDAARRLLARARKTAPLRRARPRAARADQPWSGAGPDARDPERLDASLGELVRDREWARPLRAAGLLPRWEQIVGSDIAAHCRPERLIGGELTVVAESTAWATQLRLMAPSLLGRISNEVGAGVVRRLTVHGPTAPDWRHGPLRVTGRGPRDTYG